jgi:hypothetical protein
MLRKVESIFFRRCCGFGLLKRRARTLGHYRCGHLSHWSRCHSVRPTGTLSVVTDGVRAYLVCDVWYCNVRWT